MSYFILYSAVFTWVNVGILKEIMKVMNVKVFFLLAQVRNILHVQPCSSACVAVDEGKCLSKNNDPQLQLNRLLFYHSDGNH